MISLIAKNKLNEEKKSLKNNQNNRGKAIDWDEKIKEIDRRIEMKNE